jgi:uncharacterized membrane protein
MDLYMVILRLLHIFAGVFWVGATLFLWRFVTPVVQKLGPDGAKFMRTLLKETPFALVIPAAAIITTLSGLLLFDKVSNHFDADWMSLASSMVLSIGAVAGMGAAGHGLFVVRPLVKQIVALGDQMAAAGDAPTPAQLSAMQALQAKMSRNLPIVVALLLAALAGMAAARYV